MSIKIEQLLPLMRKGWVAMDKDGCWNWFATKPEMIMADFWNNEDEEMHYIGSEDIFEIEPVEDWTQSLMECGE